MRAHCSIKGCQFEGETSKVHQTFEGLEGINICWDCGDKILSVSGGLDEFKLRLQIAQEIEDLICTTPHLSSDVSVFQVERYSYRRAAEIARGK